MSAASIIGLILIVVLVGGLFGILGYVLYTHAIAKAPPTVGAIVQYRFLACPAHLTVAAFGPDGSELNVDPSASISLGYCDLPGSAGTRSSWLSSAGLNFLFTSTATVAGVFSDFCASLTKSLLAANTPENTCTPNTTDCLPCTDESGLTCTPCMECNFTALTCSVAATDPATGHNPACPIGVPCGANGLCSITQMSSFSCYVGADATAATGSCQVYTQGVCPPAPPCFRGTVTVPLPDNGQFAAGAMLGGCQAADVEVVNGGDGVAAASAKNPCTGCAVGQTCDAADGFEIGTCSGYAHPYKMINVDMLAEGVVTNVLPGNVLEVQWERVQCIMPWHAVGTPQLHLGCVAVRSLTSESFQNQIFGSSVSAATGVMDIIYDEADYIQGLLQNYTWNLPNQVSTAVVRRIARYTIDPNADPSQTFQRQYLVGPTTANDFFGSISYGVGPKGVPLQGTQ